MSLRLYKHTNWLWCLLALHAGSFWGHTRSVTVKTPPSNPSTIEAQAKFFQDFFSVQLSPYKIEFGHVCEDPNTWEQRYEKKDFKNHRDMGKVRWGDKKGGYGEHYWDLNHAGHAGNHGDDGYDGDHNDGSYHESSDPYDEHNVNSPSYDNDDYDPEKTSYEESGRAKRAHPKIKVEKKHHRKTETYEEVSKPEKQKRKNKDELEAVATQHDEEYAEDEEEEEEEEEEPYEKPKPKPKRQKLKTQDENNRQINQQQPKEKNQVVLVVTQKDDTEKQEQPQYNTRHQEEPQYNSRQQEQSQYNTRHQEEPQYNTRQQEQPQYNTRHQEEPQYNTRQQDFSQNVPKKQQGAPLYAPPRQAELPQYAPTRQAELPYEGGAGVRQHQQPEVSAATTVPRLFLEPSTGHVVDRATGQAYVLQPIAVPKNYN